MESVGWGPFHPQRSPIADVNPGEKTRVVVVRSSSSIVCWLNATLGKTDQGEHATSLLDLSRTGPVFLFSTSGVSPRPRQGARTRRFFLFFFFVVVLG
jgi:hypothetical protein